MGRRGLLAAVAASLWLGGCAGDPPPERRGRPTGSGGASALCAELLRPRVTGRVQTPEATELSGLVVSRSQPGVLWAHNDSGDSARLFALAPDGRSLGQVAITGAQNVDWEDIALGRVPGGGYALHVADIGDNESKRSGVVVFRVPEPRLGGGSAGAAAPAARLDLRYPDGAHDAEALLVDPFDGTLAVVTKSFGGGAFLYVAHPPRAGMVVLRRAGRIPVAAGEAVTAGDVSADGRTIVLRTYDRALVWSRRRGESLAAALRREPCAAGADLAGEGQGEALALGSEGRAFYTVPEGRRPALRRYGPVR